jgi:hypothetical protein
LPERRDERHALHEERPDVRLRRLRLVDELHVHEWAIQVHDAALGDAALMRAMTLGK